jgi:hypothetical protein
MARRTYRLYTVADVPFDAFPQYADGGPSMVVNTEYGVSYSSTCKVLSSPGVVAADDGLVTLNAYASPYTGEKHALDGTKYATQTDARRAAYEAGLLAFMVYDDSKHALVVTS